MRQKKIIPDDELRRLKTKGWSHERLRRHFGVSKSTIKRRLRALSTKRKQNNMTFAIKLENLTRVAPPGFCRDQIMRLVSEIRERVPDEEKKAAVLASIESGALAVIEIAEDCRLPRPEVERILDLLKADGKVVERVPGGVRNRGRRMKLHYALAFR